MDSKFKTQPAIIISDVYNANVDSSKKGGSDKKMAPSPCFDICNVQWSTYYNFLKQWNQKKHCLDESNKHLSQYSAARQLPKDTSDTLAYILKEETSIIVVQSAVKLICLFKLAVVPNFYGWKKITSQLLCKFKERKLEDDVANCLLSLHETIKLSELLLIVKAQIIGDKLSSINPNAKKCIPSWIAKHITLHPHCLKPNEAFQLGEMLISLTNDSHPEVREEVLNALGILKSIPEYKLDTLINVINSPKKKILLKYAEAYSKSIRTEPPSIESSTIKDQSYKPSIDASIISEYDVAVEKLKTTIDNEIIEGLNSNNATERVEALNKLKDIMKNIVESDTTILKEAQESYICLITKAARIDNENSSELIRVSLSALSLLTINITISQESLKCFLPFIIETGAEQAFIGQIEDMLLGICDNTGPSSISHCLLDYANHNDSETNYAVAYSLLIKMMEEYSLKLFPAQSIIKYCRLYILNKSRKQWIIKLLKVVYSEVGPHLLFCFHNTTDEIIKELANEFSLISFLHTPKANKTVSVTSNGDTEQSISIIEYAIPRSTISIPGEILIELESPVNAVDSILKIRLLILNSYARVAIMNLADLIKSLSRLWKDENTKIILECLSLLILLCKSIGKDLSTQNNIIVSFLSTSLANSISSVKNAAYQAFTEYAFIAGHDVIVQHFANALLKGNPSLRLECLKWLANEYPKCAQCEHQLLIPGILSSLQDPSLEIRKMAEELLSLVASSLQISLFNTAIEKLKPDARLMLQQVISQCYSTKITSPNASNIENEEISLQSTKHELDLNVSLILQARYKPNAYDILQQVKQQVSQAPQFNFEKSHIPMGDIDHSLLSSPLIKSIKIAAKSKTKKSIEGKITNIIVQKVPQKGQRQGKLAAARSSKQFKNSLHLNSSFDSHSSASTSRTASLKYAYSKDVYKQCSIQVVVRPKSKEERLEFEKCIWPMTENKAAYMEVLKKQLLPIISNRIFDQMFNTTDFTKHVDCINSLTISLKTEYNELVSILDLILKWLAFGSIDVNTGILKAEVEFLEMLYQQLKAYSYSFLKCETKALIPILIRLINSSNYYIKNKGKEMLAQAAQFTAPAKIASCLIKVLKSANTKLKIECMEILFTLVTNLGTKIIEDKDLNVLANSICTKEVMLKCDINKIIVEILNNEGDNGWARMGKLSDKATKEIQEKSTDAIKIQNCYKKADKVISSIRQQITKCSNCSSQRNSSLEMATHISFDEKMKQETTTYSILAKRDKINRKSSQTKFKNMDLHYSTKQTKPKIPSVNSNNSSTDEIKVDSTKNNNVSNRITSSFVQQSIKLNKNKDSNKSSLLEPSLSDKDNGSKSRINISKQVFDIENTDDVIALASHLIANSNTNIYQVTRKVICIVQTAPPISQLESLLDAYTKYQPLEQITDAQLLTDLLVQILILLDDRGRNSKGIGDSLDSILNRSNEELVTIALIKVLIETADRFRIILSKGFNKLSKRIRVATIPSVLLEINKFILLKSIAEKDLYIIKPFITECIRKLEAEGISQIQKFPFCESIQQCLEEVSLLQFEGFSSIIANLKYMSREKILSTLTSFAEQHKDFDVNKALKVYAKQITTNPIVEKEGTPPRPTEKQPEKNRAGAYLKANPAEENISQRYQKLTQEINRLKTNGKL